jgi:hypothetical protein
MSRALGRGATWMMQPSVKKQFGAEGVKILSNLRKTPVAKWNRYWQDRAFFTIWRGGKGRSHWGGLCWLALTPLLAALWYGAQASPRRRFLLGHNLAQLDLREVHGPHHDQ